MLAVLLVKTYYIIWLLLTPFIPLVLIYRAIQGKERFNRINERIGIAKIKRPKGELVWINAASVGELRSTIPLIKRLIEEDLKILLSYKDIGEQDDVGLGETSTAGYDMLDMRVTKTIEAGNGTLNISVFGSNLLDEVARNHSSFVKNEVPLAGRSYGAKFTYKF